MPSNLSKPFCLKALSSLLLLTLLLCCRDVQARRRRRRRRRRRKSRPQTPKEQTPRMKARKLVIVGARLLKGGYYVGALDKFKRAYALYPSPKIFFNIGQTQKELGRYVKALEAYEKFLKKTPKDTPKELKDLAKERMADLRKRIGTLSLQISHPNAKVSVNGTTHGVSPLKGPIRLMPGSHSLVIKKKGYVTEALDFKLKAGQSLKRKVVLKLPKKEVVQVKVIYKTVKIPQKGLALFWTGTAVTAAVSLAASILGGLALGEEKKMGDSSLSIQARRDAADRGDLYAKITDGLLISGGVLAAGTLLWYLFYVRPSGGTKRVRLAPKDPSTPSTTLWPSFQNGQAGLSLSF